MICGLEDIRTKEVIDIKTGERLGYVDDVQMNLDTSEIIALVINGRQRFFGLLGKETDVVIPCGDIKVIGRDTLLIKRNNETNLTDKTKHHGIFPEILFE